MNVVVFPIGGPPDKVRFEDIDRVSYVNSESFGPSEKIGSVSERSHGERVLVVNVNAVSTVLVET